MNCAVDSSNKALVLEAFDTLFNKRDYVAAERYWSPHYIQHSAHMGLSRWVLNFTECDGRTSYPLFTAFWGIAT
jgi:predicted SnoaL-like aldol condensation-catalyzing enzyme